jgi:hypothetical protein
MPTNPIITWIKSHKLIVFFVIVLLLFGVFALLNGSLRVPSSKQTTTTASAVSVNKSGLFFCLPEQKKHGLTTTCSLAIKADDGKYYLLVEGNAKRPVIDTGILNSRVQISGLLTGIKSSSSSAVGTIAVKTIARIQ